MRGKTMTCNTKNRIQEFLSILDKDMKLAKCEEGQDNQILIANLFWCSHRGYWAKIHWGGALKAL